MRNRHAVCCGLDVHAKSIVACVRVQQPNEPAYTVKSFGTMPEDLDALNQWLDSFECKVVAMESTGVYWKPVHLALYAQGRDVLVANPARIKQIPGFKTDRNDARRISDLLAADLVPRSFVLDAETHELRELVRLRVQYVQQRTKVRNQIVRVLEMAGIKLMQVVDSLRVEAGRRMLRAIAEGCNDPAELARMRHPRMKASEGEIARALANVRTLSNDARTRLRMLLKDQEHVEAQLADLFELIAPLLEPKFEVIEKLQTIGGIGHVAALTAISELGTDVGRSFATHKQLTSWAGVCPGNHESAGKRFGGKSCRGNKYLKRVLVEAAWSLKNDPGYLGRRFRALKHRLGGKKAAVAMAHRLLVEVYRVLTTGEPYREPQHRPPDPEQQDHQRARRYINRLRELGYDVTATPRLQQPQRA
jgi:transposase